MTEPTQDDLRKIYADTKTIAVVGASADEAKASHRIPRYLQSQGYRIIPVSPKGGEILGEIRSIQLISAGFRSCQRISRRSGQHPTSYPETVRGSCFLMN